MVFVAIVTIDNKWNADGALNYFLHSYYISNSTYVWFEIRSDSDSWSEYFKSN